MVPRARIELATRGFSVRNASDENPKNTGGSGVDDEEVTPKVTPADAKTSQIEDIRAALAGLSKDELIGLLADALASNRE